MFGRRRQRAPIVHAPVPELSDDVIRTLVHDRIAEMIGPRGDWSLVRRTAADTDEIFDGMLTDQVAQHVSDSLLREKARLHGEGGEEPRALGWKPEPVVVWAEPELAVAPQRAEHERIAA